MRRVGQKNDEVPARRFGHFSCFRFLHEPPLPGRLVLVLFAFRAAVFMTPALALELALHMLLESSGFSINLFLLQLRRPYLFFPLGRRRIWLLERHGL